MISPSGGYFMRDLASMLGILDLCLLYLPLVNVVSLFATMFCLTFYSCTGTTLTVLLPVVPVPRSSNP